MLRAILGFIHLRIVMSQINFVEVANVTGVTAEYLTIAPEPDLDYDVYCKFQPNAYDCDGRGISAPRFYYDILMQDCKTARFGKCRLNYNSFSSLTDCHTHCREPGLQVIKQNLSEKIYCRLQHDFGTCNDYHPLWYFDMSLRICRGFSYSGCGGNHNRFPTAQICAATCGNAIEYKKQEY